ncbi:MAG TPA: DUF4142 domain-containing protein [Cyclobacteriaceae bacterium]|jgi:putative membrane protein
MKIVFKSSFIYIVLSLLTVLFLSACVRNWTYSFTKDRNENKFRDEGMVDEVVFVMEMKSAGILMRDISSYARDSAYSAMVQKFATELNSDYILFDPELTVLAAKQGIKLSNHLNSEHWAMYRQVKGKKKADFDKEFLKVVHDVHTQLYDKSNQLAYQGKNNAIRSFCAKKINFFQQNLAQSGKLSDEVVTIN